MNNAVISLFADPICLFSEEQEFRIRACVEALVHSEDYAKLMNPAEVAAAASHEDFWYSKDDWRSSYRPYTVKAGVLLVPVKGVLLHNFPYAFGSLATGYYYIQKAIERGLVDPEVKGIALVCDSPGGMVAGCFELADMIYEARSKKPIESFAHEHAFSAAYAIASCGSRLTVSRTGGVGSIGVLWMHVSYADALKNQGVKITFVFAGKHKVDGNPYEDLSADAKKRAQARIDEFYGVFVRSVARNRKMPEKDVRGTEALTYTATEAVKIGLADKIGPLDDALAEYAADIYRTENGDDEMSDKANTATVDQAAQEKAIKDAAAAGHSAGVQAERTRIKAVLELDEAKARPIAAMQVALATAMTVEESKAFLAAIPEEPKPAAAATNSGNPAFQKKMDEQAAGPGAATGPEETAEKTDDEIAADILSVKFGAKKKSA